MHTKKPLSTKKSFVYVLFLLVGLGVIIGIDSENWSSFIKNFCIAVAISGIFLVGMIWLMNFVVVKSNEAFGSGNLYKMKKVVRIAQVLIVIGVFIQLLMAIFRKTYRDRE